MNPLGMMTVPYYEWWLHHNPFRRQGYSCPICSCDTTHFKGCPADEIKDHLAQINDLMIAFRKRCDDERNS